MLSQHQLARNLIKMFLGLLVLGAGLVAPLAGFSVMAASDYPARSPIPLLSRPIVDDCVLNLGEARDAWGNSSQILRGLSRCPTIWDAPVVYEQLTPDGPVGHKLAPNKLVGQRVVRHLRGQLSPERDFVTKITRLRQIYRELEPVADPSFLTAGDRFLRNVDRHLSECGVFTCQSPAP